MLCLHMVLGDRTFLREIRLLSPATAVRLHEGAPQPAAYWDWHGLAAGANGSRPASPDLVRETYALIERAVLRAVAGSRRAAVPLSGGLDSRLLVAVLARNGVPFRAYNVNFGREAPLARRVAEALRVPLRGLPMVAEPDTIPEAHDAVDCCYHVNQTWGWEMARAAAAEDGCDLLLDGLAFDTILGAVHHVAGEDPAALTRSLEANYKEVHPRTLAELTGAAAGAAVEQAVRASLECAAREALERAGPHASDYFLMNNRIRRYTFGYCLANLRHLPGGFPFVTRELFEHCMRLPPAERREHTLYRRIYTEMFPELARIPWAKTGLPLDRYGPPAGAGKVWAWAEAAVRRLTRGRLNLTPRGSFDARFRRRRDFREVFSGRLQAARDSACGCLPRETHRNTLRRELAGRNLGSIIQGLYTVENFLARHVDGGPVTLVG
jgi:hypothetical protein